MKFCQIHSVKYGVGTNSIKCVECTRERNKKYQKENYDRIYDINLEYFRKNKKKIYEKRKEWRLKNKERLSLAARIRSRSTEVRECKRKSAKKRYYSDIDAARERSRNYGKIWRMRHPDRMKESLKKFRLKNKEKLNEYVRLWRKTEHGKHIVSANNKKSKAARRNAKIDNTINASSLSELLKSQDGNCAICGKKLLMDKSTHLDHIFPIFLGGLHTISNVRYTCQTCNLTRTYKEYDLNKTS